MWTCILQFRSNPDRVNDLIVRRYSQPLQAFARHLGLSHENAEDVVQETFVRVCNEQFLLGADRRKGKFRTLLLAVLKNVISECRRHDFAGLRDRRREVPLGDLDLPDPHQEEPDFNRMWVLNLVTQAFENLKEDPTIPSLRLQTQGKSYKEIADELGLKESDVTNNIHRAKPRLKRELERLIAQYCTQEEFPEEIAALVKYM
jgi:RNA polymerase sigma-70 factor (ECF subfamily)